MALMFVLSVEKDGSNVTTIKDFDQGEDDLLYAEGTEITSLFNQGSGTLVTMVAYGETATIEGVTDGSDLIASTYAYGSIPAHQQRQNRFEALMMQTH